MLPILSHTQIATYAAALVAAQTAFILLSQRPPYVLHSGKVCAHRFLSLVFVLSTVAFVATLCVGRGLLAPCDQKQ